MSEWAGGVLVPFAGHLKCFGAFWTRNDPDILTDRYLGLGAGTTESKTEQQHRRVCSTLQERFSPHLVHPNHCESKALWTGVAVSFPEPNGSQEHATYFRTSLEPAEFSQCKSSVGKRQHRPVRLKAAVACGRWQSPGTQAGPLAALCWQQWEMNTINISHAAS